MSQLDDLIGSYLKHGRGGRATPTYERSIRSPGWAVEFCGDEARTTLTFVRANALLLLGVGTQEEMVARFELLQREGVRYEDLEVPGVVWGNERRTFRPVGEGLLVGVVEREHAAVLLGLFGETCAVVLLEGRHRAIVSVCPWSHLGVVDVDAFLLLAPRKHAGSRVVVCDQEVTDRTCAGLRALAARAIEPCGALGSRQRGKASVRAFLEVLVALGQKGCGDLVGRVSDILEEVARYLPEHTLRAETLGHVLVLLERTNTGLVERATARTWRVRLLALRDAASPVHRAVCSTLPQRRLAPVLAPEHRLTPRAQTAGELLRATAARGLEAAVESPTAAPASEPLRARPTEDAVPGWTRQPPAALESLLKKK